MRKKFSILALVMVLLALVAYGAGFTPAYLSNAPSVATGIGARLACSMHYVQGKDTAQLRADITVYSPMLRFLRYEFDDAQQTASASLAGYTRTASFVPGLGCDLDYPDLTLRHSLHWPAWEPVVAPWPLGQEVDTLRPELNDKLAAMLAEDNALAMDTRALLVVHNGQIVAEAYAPSYDANSVFLGWSMSKSVTALLVGQLELEGRLQTQERRLFADWQDERRDITLEQLLQMTDGLDYEETYQPGYSAPTMLFQSPDSAAYMQAQPLKTVPGEQYRYSSGSTNLVMKVVQERSGGSAEKALQRISEHFFKPLGFAPMVFEVDNAGLLMGSSYLYASARNWAKIGQLMLDNGEINGVRLVSEDFVQRSIAPNSAEQEQDRDFGYNWWLNTDPVSPRWPSLSPTAYAAKGSREQRVMVLPEQRLVIVRLGWSAEPYRDDRNFSEIASWF